MKLTHIADSFVGSPDDGGGISGGERKRLAIGTLRSCFRGWACLCRLLWCRYSRLASMVLGRRGVCSGCVFPSVLPWMRRVLVSFHGWSGAGVELVCGSRVLLLDEPTSGLDSLSADLVMRVLRDVASAGCVVICSIHQPTTRVFRMFDKVTNG